MVRVIYRQKKGDVSGAAGDDASILFVNGKGSYYLSAPVLCDPVHSWSRYEGLYLPYKTADGWNMYKVMHGLFPSNPGNSGVSAITRDLCFYQIDYASGAQLQYSFLPNDVLAVEIKACNDALRLILDCRGIHDFDAHGRFYTSERIFVPDSNGGNRSVLLVTYMKHQQDDAASPITQLPGCEQLNTAYIAIWSTAPIEEKNNWFAFTSILEQQRGNGPWTNYVYHAADILCRGNGRVLVAGGFDRASALANIMQAAENFDHLVRTMRQYAGSLSSPASDNSNRNSSQDATIRLAREQAILSLNALLVKPNDAMGIYAGLPWFFQFWTRDEATATGGLLAVEQYKDAKELLSRQIKNVLADGRLSNRYPYSQLGSADGVGWSAKRWYDLIKQLANQRRLGEYISDKELAVLRDFFIDSYEKLKVHYADSKLDGLFRNSALETWMDTGVGSDVREGYRIEIQALALIQLRLINTLISLVGSANRKSYQEEETLLAANVAKRFFVDKALLDGISLQGEPDKTLRPNIFIAYYVYPWLLSSKQWESAFDAVLPAVWLAWGGLASIDVSSPLFCPTYTGENNHSYHRGDSWYFLNNLAAIGLLRVNAEKYKREVNAILDASIKDLLWGGTIGYSSEISSARTQTASACTAQAWSIGTLLELLHQLEK